jgi:DNA polymerase/3'-5' exonuclease PolX
MEARKRTAIKKPLTGSRKIISTLPITLAETFTMGRKLSSMAWDSVQKEMSIAGSAEKITQLGRDIEILISSTVDATNRAELTNVEFMLQRLTAEVKLWQRMYDRTH